MFINKWLQCNANAEEGNGNGTESQPADTGAIDLNGTLTIDTPDTSTSDNAPADEKLEQQQLDPNQKVPITPKTKAAKLQEPDKGDELVPLDDLREELVTDKSVEKEKQAKEQEKQQKQLEKDKPAENKEQQQRDYKIFGDEDSEVVQYLKKAPNHVFAVAHKLASELQQSKAAITELQTKYDDASKGIVKLPENYRTNKQAYIFDPKYAELRQNITLTAKIKEHYLDQISKIEAGEPWQDITDVKDDGSFVYSNPVEAGVTTSRQKELIRQHITGATNNAMQFQAAIDELKQEHITKYTELKTGIEAHAKQMFPWMGDEKQQTELKVNIKDPKTGKPVDLNVKQIGDHFRAIIPSQFRGDVLYEPLVNSLIANVLAKAHMSKGEEKKQVTQQLVKDKLAAESTNTGKNGSGAKSAASNLIGSLADMRE